MTGFYLAWTLDAVDKSWIRSSRSQMYVRIGVLRYCKLVTGKRLHSRFSMKIAKFLRIFFYWTALVAACVGYLFLFWIKVGLSPSKKNCHLLVWKPFKSNEKCFLFRLKRFFVLKIFQVLSRHFGHVGKTAWLER